MIWDHLFGTYQAELPNIKIRYGLSHPRSSPSNPFVIAYEDFWRMLKEERPAMACLVPRCVGARHLEERAALHFGRK
jgi:hypothetical protein